MAEQSPSVSIVQFTDAEYRRLVFIRWLVLNRRLTDGESIAEAERWGMLTHRIPAASGTHILPNGRVWRDPDDHSHVA